MNMARLLVAGFRRLVVLAAAVTAFAAPATAAGTAAGVPVLLYHRFGATAADSMTVRTSVFESHLRYLRENGYKVIPLKQVIDALEGRFALPERAVVIVADDAHKSVYTEMFPRIKAQRIPVTLFVYPSAVSNASYAMTWAQLREMKESGFADIQSHTYWHPHFMKERRRMSAGEFDKFVASQFSKSREKLRKECGTDAELLAWPFGLYDDDLMKRASAAGFRAAFSIERRHVTPSEKRFALPRYLIIDADGVPQLAQILRGAAPPRKIAY